MGLFDVDNTQDQQQAGGLFGQGLPGVNAANVVVQALPGTTLASIPAPYAPHGTGELSDQEAEDLKACKAGVDNLRNAFWVAGKALETARTAELHRRENPNFAQWVWDTWEISETQLYRLMDEWRVGEALANLGHKPPESHVRAMTEIRRQTTDKVAITVYDTIARCVDRVTGALVEKVVTELGALPKDVATTDVSSRVRSLLATPGQVDSDSKSDSPIGESTKKPRNTKADTDDTKDIERLQATLASLEAAAKKVNKAAARRAVEAQPDTAVPLIRAIGSALQQIDRAVAIKLPTEK